MAEKVRSLIKVINNEINKHWLFNHANAIVNKVTGKAQDKLDNIQNSIVSKYDVVAKQVNNDITVFKNLSATNLKPSPLPIKVAKWMQWYQQVTGLDVVEMAKQQVIKAQDELFKCQKQRRQLNRAATLITDKLKEVYSELIQIKRDDPKYVQLTIIENKSLQEQARIISELNLLEREEKDRFTVLATAIKEYHDSQTMNAQKYKYLSIIASAILAIISLTSSMIYNSQRIKNIRVAISETQQKNESMFKDSINTIEYNITKKITEVFESNSSNNNRIAKREDAKLQYMETLRDFQNVYVTVGLCIVGLYVIKILTG